MAASPDDRFAGLLNASAEHGGWVPGDVFTADSAGEEEPVAPRRVRLPILVTVAIATVGVLILAIFLFRPADQHAPTDTGQNPEAQSESPAADAGPAESANGNPAPVPGTSGEAPEGSGEATGNSGQATGQVIVHVTGAVSSPSVVTLDAGARVQDAIEAVGGLSESADAEAVNLARVVTDGEQIHIPQKGEEPTGTGPEAVGPGAAGKGVDAGASANGAGGTGPEADGAGGGAGAPGAAGKVDLNTADLTTLQTLPGVGPVTAEAIISHRQTQPFASVEDLLLVTGIGPKTFESLKDLVTVG